MVPQQKTRSEKREKDTARKITAAIPHGNSR
jgi:hypothetical protein